MRVTNHTPAKGLKTHMDDYVWLLYDDDDELRGVFTDPLLLTDEMEYPYLWRILKVPQNKKGSVEDWGWGND